MHNIIAPWCWLLCKDIYVAQDYKSTALQFEVWQYPMNHLHSASIDANTHKSPNVLPLSLSFKTNRNLLSLSSADNKKSIFFPPQQGQSVLLLQVCFCKALQIDWSVPSVNQQIIERSFCVYVLQGGDYWLMNMENEYINKYVNK